MLVSRMGRKGKVILSVLLFLLCIFVAGCGGDQENIAIEQVILDNPPNNFEIHEGEITFRWHLENTRDGITYNYTILFDKGCNPYDGNIEYSVEIGEATEYNTYLLSTNWLSPAFEWGVIAQSSDGYIFYAHTRVVWIV